MIEANAPDEENLRVTAHSGEDKSLLPASDPALDRPSNPQKNQNVMVVKLIGKRLYIDGFVYVKNRSFNNKLSWECKRCRGAIGTEKCTARAMTSDPVISGKLILYRGLEESKHNHEPSPREVEDAEARAEFCVNKRREPAAVARTLEFDKDVIKSESKRPVRSSAEGASYNLDLSYDIGPMPPKLIGNRLNIDEFIYKKSYSYIVDGHLSKIYWICKRYKKEKCPATAITSDSSKGGALIVYKGPDESKHDHPPYYADVEEAEESAKDQTVKNNPKSELMNQVVSKAVPAVAQSSTSHVSKLVTGEIKNIGSPQPVQSALGHEILALTDPNNGCVHKQMRMKLIGKRLCIDGYIYIKHSNGVGINWVCKRYRKTGCSARAFTSDSSLEGELTAYRVDHWSGHDHPPDELEVEEAELMAKLELNRFKLASSQFAQNHNESSSVSIPDPNRSSHRSDTEEKCAVVTSPEAKQPPQPKMEKKPSSPPSKIINSQKSARLIGKRLCIDGYVYTKSNNNPNSISWECIRYRKSGCRGRAVTSDTSSAKELVVYKGPEKSKHDHPPSHTEIEDSEDLVKMRRKWRKSKSRIARRVCGKDKSEIPQLQPNHYEASSSARIENVGNVTAADARSQSQLLSSKTFRESNRTHVSSTTRRVKRMGLMKDDQVYRKFLVEFSKRPIFDRRSVVEALKVIYSSKQGCLMAYATVLENRKKIEQDLETLKKNLNVTIAALKSDRPSILNDEVMDIDGETQQGAKHTALNEGNLMTYPDNNNEKGIICQQTAELNNSTVLESNNAAAVQNENAAKTNRGEETKPMVSDFSAPRMEVATESSKPQEPPLHRARGVLGTIPPVPAAVAVEELSLSQTSATTLVRDEPEIKREIICIDLTDDFDKAPKLEPESAIHTDILSQSNPTTEVTSATGNVAPLSQNVQLNSTQSMGDPFSNFLREMSRFRLPEQNHLQNQFTMHPNHANAYYNPAMCIPFNCGTESLNFNSPYIVNNLQVPLMINVPSMKNRNWSIESPNSH